MNVAAVTSQSMWSFSNRHGREAPNKAGHHPIVRTSGGQVTEVEGLEAFEGEGGIRAALAAYAAWIWRIVGDV